MKKLLLGSVALVVLSGAANAADLGARPYTKAPAYVQPSYDWSGFYVGAHVGGAFNGNNGFTSTNTNIVGTRTDTAFLGGGQIGADYQFAASWVVGVEGQFSGLSDDRRTFTVGPAILRDNNDWLASVTGRLGYTWGPGLVYGKGGVAFRNNDGLSVNPGINAEIISSTRDSTGYTVGAGIEYFFAPQWSGKVEYQYYNFDRTTVTTNFPGIVSYRDDLHTVKLGVNYHFNWGGPVVAKY